MKKSVLRNYAKVIAKVGANVQKGQYVIVNADVSQDLLASYVAEECYKLGASKVVVEFSSNKVAKVHYKKASVKNLSDIPEWRIEKEKYYNKILPVTIWLDSDDPDGLKGVNQAKLAAISKRVYPIMKPLRDERENKYQWNIVGVPAEAWAKKVFPHLSKKKAVEELWKAVLSVARCDGVDPIKAWDEHNKNLARYTDFMNSLDIDYLEYHSTNGTNFRVWLSHEVNWCAGGEHTLGTNIYYNPNIPTEECFTSPIKGKAEGIVYSTKPLSYQGQLIENFSIRFKDGKAIEVHAEKNEELLKHMISMDPGAAYLGEVALVPFDSPINKTGLLFYNTLFDENAACHLALGMGFTNLVKDYDKYTNEELHQKGINDSSIHVDFMIGSKDLDIVAHLKDGKKVQIFKEGNWAF